MTVIQSHKHSDANDTRGFTLTEMLAAILIMTLASTMLATGIPVGIEVYHLFMLL